MTNLYYDNSRGGFYSQEAADSIFSGAMTRLYGWIAMGLVTTGAVAWISYQAGILTNLGLIGNLLLLGVWIGCLFALRFAASRVPPAVLGALYLVFTAIGGVMTSYIFWAYAGSTIVLAFALTAGVFGAMSAIGYTTKRDLTGLGALLVIGLIGVVITGVINIFIGSGVISWIIALVALPIFMGLVVYETKQVKELAQEAAANGDERAAIIGAVGLYLAFLNIFLILLRILDFFNSD